MSLILPRHEWPPTDRALWDRIFREGDLLDDQGPLAHLRLTSRETLANGYGRWLAWLRDTQPDALKDPPATRVTLERLEAWLTDLAHTAPMSRLFFVDRVLRVMQVGFPDQNWSRHKQLQLHLKRRAELTKTGVPWESVVPEPVLPSLHRYLTEARPLLLVRGPGGYPDFWIDRNGLPLSYGMIAVAVANATEAMLGIRGPPHFFRDAAATTLARGSPQAAAQIRPVLAHTSSKTAERYYNHATTLEAGRDYAAVVAKSKGKKP